MTPCRTPNSRNATVIDRIVSTVRIGLRQSPAHSSGRYFTLVPPLSVRSIAHHPLVNRRTPGATEAAKATMPQMTHPSPRDRVRNYYAQFGEREWLRLTNAEDGAVEFAVTCHALASYLPKHGRILDIGGGPGRYTIWLAQRGYTVVLADLS